jgi:hypothetical protein
MRHSFISIGLWMIATPRRKPRTLMIFVESVIDGPAMAVGGKWRRVGDTIRRCA